MPVGPPAVAVGNPKAGRTVTGIDRRECSVEPAPSQRQLPRQPPRPRGMPIAIPARPGGSARAPANGLV
eukprot:357604-Chlamydomonas_euryale.AAC.3